MQEYTVLFREAAIATRLNRTSDLWIYAPASSELLFSIDEARYAATMFSEGGSEWSEDGV